MLITDLQVNGSAEVLSSIDGKVAKLLLDAEDLVELGKALGTGWGTGLDLAGAETNDDVGDGDVLGFAGAVGDHDTPVGGVRVLGGLDRLGEGTDLVDLEEEGVAGLELDGLLDADGVGNGQIVTTLISHRSLKRDAGHLPDNLEVRGLVEVAPGLPVILIEGVLNADNGVLGSKGLVQVCELLIGEPLALVGLGVLEVEVVFLLLGLVELAGGDIKGDVHLASVSGLLDGVGDEVKGLLGGLDIGSNTALVTNVAGRLAVLLLGKGLQLVVDLRTLAQGLGEGWSGANFVSGLQDSK